MARIPTYIIVILSLFVIALLGTGLLYIWDPAAVTGAFVIRLALSFGVVLGGAVLLALAGRLMKAHRRPEGESRE